MVVDNVAVESAARLSAEAKRDDATPGEAFEVFCRRSYEPLVRLAFLLIGSPETAEDLVQDVLVRIQRRWHRIEQPNAYARRAVVNACNTHHRRRRREDQQPRPVDEAVALDADELFDVLAALPERMRAAIVLRFYEDLPDGDIAALLDCAPSTVRSLIHRGLARLRRVVET